MKTNTTNAKRVLGTPLNIGTDDIRDFFNQRARNHIKRGERQPDLSTVLLGDSDSVFARRWDEFDREHILPLLKKACPGRILDIGCGIGRWAGMLLPLCEEYRGVDFSPEMIRSCQKSFPSAMYANARFEVLSFQEVTADTPAGTTYDLIILPYVSMYLNDDELRQCYARLPQMMSPGGRLYIEDSVGVDQRLTLSEVWSVALNSTYSATYRTREEYLELLQPVLEVSSIEHEAYMRELDNAEFPETTHWFAIFRKNE